MKKLLLTALAIPLFITAEPWVDYELSEEVVEMTVVTVKLKYKKIKNKNLEMKST